MFAQIQPEVFVEKDDFWNSEQTEALFEGKLIRY